MKFTRFTAEKLELARDIVCKYDIDTHKAHKTTGTHTLEQLADWGIESWESHYVVRSGEREDIALSIPGSNKSLGIYFQPLARSGGPVIMLHELTEIYRVEM